MKIEMNDFANRINAADTAIKMRRIEINIAARNVREMVIDSDDAAHEVYKQKVEDAAEELAKQMAILKEADVFCYSLYLWGVHF